MNFLIIDDEVMITRLIASTLQHNPKTINDSIHFASSGQEALEMLYNSSYHPDVVLIDYSMPGLDGLETAKAIKKWCSEKDWFVYIIMITANSKIEAASLKVVDDFIKKPFDAARLNSRIGVAKRIAGLIQGKNKLLKQNIQLNEHLNDTGEIHSKLVNRLSMVIDQMSMSLSETIEHKEHNNKEHVFRVGGLAAFLAEELGLDNKKAIRQAAIFHDIGKIGIPDHILKKTDSLSSDEFELVKKHPRVGAEIIKPIDFFKESVDGILYHHERWDGKGYPDGLAGDDIPAMARVVSVADVFDVLMTDRPYNTARNFIEARNELLKFSGSQFDPDVVAGFDKLFQRGDIEAFYRQPFEFSQASLII